MMTSMKTLESRDITRACLTSALDVGEWSASCPGRCNPSVSRWLGGWVDPRADLDAVAEKLSAPDGNRIQVVQPVA